MAIEYWEVVTDPDTWQEQMKGGCCSYVVDPDSFRVYVGFLHAKVCRKYGLHPGKVYGGWVYPLEKEKVQFDSGYLASVPKELRAEVRKVMTEWAAEVTKDFDSM